MVLMAMNSGLAPSSASPTKPAFQSSKNNPSSHRHSSQTIAKPKNEFTKGRRRCSSLSERFPGDMSHRPLDQLRKETKAAYRAPHLKKKHIPGTDTIDSLDSSAFGLLYHHGGPYDATLLARNRNRKIAPVEALKSSNDEALKATPKEYIKDALERHMPLQGTATIPSGMKGCNGQYMQYEEGADLMREPDAPGGAYKRWPDMKYHPDDLKGKGEPSYTIEKSLKKDKDERRKRLTFSGNTNAYELLPLRSPSSNLRTASGSKIENNSSKPRYDPSASSENYLSRGRSLSTGLRLGESLRKRLETLARGRKTNYQDVVAQ